MAGPSRLLKRWCRPLLPVSSVMARSWLDRKTTGKARPARLRAESPFARKRKMEAPLARLPVPLTAWICAVLVPLGPIASTAARGEGSPSLRLEAKIPLGHVSGRIDHMAVDLPRQRLFVAELGNGTRGCDRPARKERTANAAGLSRAAGRRLRGVHGHTLRRERRGRVAAGLSQSGPRGRAGGEARG